PTLTLSKTPKGLLINGRPLGLQGAVAGSLESAMLALLQDSQVKSVSFKKGLTLDELITFLHALTKKFWDVKDGKEINKRLRDERVLLISVDEITYVALGEGGVLFFEQARTAMGEVTRLLRESPRSFHDPLRRIGKVLLEAFRHNPQLMAMMGALLSDQAPDMTAAAAASPAEPPAVTRASG